MRIWMVLAAAAVAFVVPLAGVADATAPQEAASSVWTGVYTTEQADRGRAIYLGKCAQCHAENLVGNPPAPALRGAGFTARWAGQSVRDIHSRIRSTMPLNEAGSLTRQETFDVVSYLFESNGFPAGDKELSGLPAELQQIRITTQQ